MSNRLDTAVARLATRMKEHAATSVTYARGAAQVSIAAVLGETQYEEVDDNGVVMRSKAQDFLVVADDLSLSGSKVAPADGDTITHIVDGVSYVYRVASRGGEPPWRWSDEFKKRYRVHTKLMTQVG